MAVNPLSSLLTGLAQTALIFILVPLSLFYSYILGSISLFSLGEDRKVPSIFLTAARLVLGAACLVFGLGLALALNPLEPLPFLFLYSALFSIAFGGTIHMLLQPEKEVTLESLQGAIEQLTKEVRNISLALESEGIAFKPLGKAQLKSRAIELFKQEKGGDATFKSVDVGEETAAAVVVSEGKEYEVVMDLAGGLISLKQTSVLSKTGKLLGVLTGSHRQLAGLSLFLVLLLFGLYFLPPFDFGKIAAAIAGGAGDYCPKMEPLLLATAKELGSNATVRTTSNQAIAAAKSNYTGFALNYPLLVETADSHFVWLVADVRPGENITASFCMVNADSGRLCDCAESPELLSLLREKVPAFGNSLLGFLSR